MVSIRVVKTRDGPLVAVHFEIDFSAFGAADPVALHGQHAFRPALFELLHVIEQLVGVGGDFQKPLLHSALFDRRRFMPPAAAVDHLFICQHGGAFGTPVQQRLLAIGEAAFEHFEEEPLVPAIVFGLARGYFAAPIEGKAQALELHLHGGNVGERPLARMPVLLHGRVFGRQAERIPTHRMEHVIAAHPHIASEGVANGVVAHVTHVQHAAGIGQHLKHVVLGLVA